MTNISTFDYGADDRFTQEVKNKKYKKLKGSWKKLRPSVYENINGNRVHSSGIIMLNDISNIIHDNEMFNISKIFNFNKRRRLMFMVQIIEQEMRVKQNDQLTNQEN